MMLRVKKIPILLIVVLVWHFCTSFGWTQESSKLNQATQAQKQNDQEARVSQKKITKLAREIKATLNDYKSILRQTDNAKIYNQQLRLLIDSQNKERVSIKQQIENLKTIHKDIVPLMSRMLESLEKFISLDLPFLLEERKNRLTGIKTMMARADVSTSEKYRRLLEAYQIENEYGRTIETYKGVQMHNGNEIIVDFLRIGRLSLVYQSMDGKSMGYWNHRQKQWMNLPRTYKKEIRKGIRMTNKQLAPDLIKVPIPPPRRKNTP